MRLIIVAGRLITDVSKPPLLDSAVTCEDGVITGIGDRPPLGGDDRVIDCSTCTVMPGLIDSHVHVCADTTGELSLEAALKDDSPRAVLRGVRNLRVDLESGVTTMRSLGEPKGLDQYFKDALEQRSVIGPRLLTCGRPLRPSHGTAGFLGVAADGEEAIRKRIRRNFYQGATWIKLFVSNVMNGERYVDYLQGDLTSTPAYTRKEIWAAIDEAHALGLKVAAHAIGGPAMRWAIEEGIDSIEHANLMCEGDVELFVKHETTLSDPNLQLFFDEVTGFHVHQNWKYDWWREKVLDARERTRRFLPEALRAGVRVCLAIDSNHPYLWKEVEHFVELGAKPEQALAAVTSSTAALLGLESQIGVIEPGKGADLIAVAGDPQSNVSALRNVRLVIRQGEVVVDEIWRDQPAAGSPALAESSTSMGSFSRAVL